MAGLKSAFITIIFSAVSLAGFQAPLTVHEWGTFTSIAGEDGTAVEWSAQDGPQDLPCFVERFRSSNVKSWMLARIRMETPVLYFYVPREMTVSVRVRFRQGMVSEWYPHAAVAPASLNGVNLRSAVFESSIAWNDVRVWPALAPKFLDEGRPSHYYTARNVDASPLQSGSQKERFLFYRGIGGFQPPLTATIAPDGNVVVASPAGEPVGDVILFENRGGTMSYDVRRAAASRVTFEPTLEGEAVAPLAELEALLIANGLYPKEAKAMVQTWRDSWFEEGTRLFYIASRKTVDAILPLEITPSPSNVERVFVGRIEIITPAMEADVRRAIDRGDVAALRKHGRFLDPMIARVLAKSAPGERNRLQALLRPIYLAWPALPAACK